MPSLDLLTDKKLYDPSFQRFNYMHWNMLAKYLFHTVDHDSRESKMEEYGIANPALGYFIIKDYIKANSLKVDYIMNFLTNQSDIAVVIGDAGTGKTAFMHWLMQELHYRKIDKNRPLTIIRDDIPAEYPKWLDVVSDINDAKDDAIIGWDEAAVSLSARRAMSSRNIENAMDLAIRRHNGWSIIYMSQHSHFLDLNILRMATCFFFKKLSKEEIMRSQKEQTRTIDLLTRYVDAMEPQRPSECLFWDGKVWYKFTNPLPDFWSDRLSKSYKKITTSDAIDLAVTLDDRGVSEKEILNRLRAKGVKISQSELNNWIAAPDECKEEYKKEKKLMWKT